MSTYDNTFRNPPKRRQLPLGLWVIALLGLLIAVATITGKPANPPVAPATIKPHADDFQGWGHYVILAAIGFQYAAMARELVAGNARATWHYFKRVNWKSLLASLPVLAAMIVLSEFFNGSPLLNRSWLYHFQNESANLNTAAFHIPIWGWLAAGLLILSLPDICATEERFFRGGTCNWWNAVPRSLAFGFMHCLVGVSLGTGLALTGAGLWFTLQYFKGGLERSTTYHLSYNLIICTLLLGYLAFGK